MRISFLLLYAYPTTSGAVKERYIVEDFDIVDISDKLALRIRNEPHISDHFIIEDDPVNDPIVFEFDADDNGNNSQWLLFDSDMFHTILARRYIPSDASFCQLMLSDNDYYVFAHLPLGGSVLGYTTG